MKKSFQMQRFESDCTTVLPPPLSLSVSERCSFLAPVLFLECCISALPPSMMYLVPYARACRQTKRSDKAVDLIKQHHRKAIPNHPQMVGFVSACLKSFAPFRKYQTSRSPSSVRETSFFGIQVSSRLRLLPSRRCPPLASIHKL